MNGNGELKTVDVVLPVHNEGGSIGATLEEFHRVVTRTRGIPVRFVVCEDGSTDNTVAVVRDLQGSLPILLITDKARKGYSRAVIDGFRACDGDLVGFIDSDGQCDPTDFSTLHEKMSDPAVDLAVGYRNPRSDHWVRLLMSGLFKTVYRMLFPVRLRDPSCPFLLIRREGLQKILQGKVGILKQGFWWEFMARAQALGLALAETPVRHRVRSAGTTQVYKPTKVPRIAWEHLLGLFALRSELKRISRAGR